MTTADARALQEELRSRNRLEPPAGYAPRLVAGADLSLERTGLRKGHARGFAAIVVVDRESMETVEEATAVTEVEFPYVPGLLSFRELPPLAEAWTALRTPPDTVIFDAHGIAHPRRFGLACHGGMLFDTPAIGVAKSVLVGAHDHLAEHRGATAPLRVDDEIVGAALRTRANVRPVYVSPGYRIDLATALETVLAVSPRYRIPEPTRRAHHAANRLRREQ